MSQRIDVPGIGIVEFPDGMNDAEISAAIRRNMPKRDHLAEARAQQMSEMSGPQQFIAGMGKAPSDMILGGRQILGLADQAEVDETKRLGKPLTDTGAGTAGNIAGTIAALAPTMIIPGLNTVAGAGLVGGVTGALQPTDAGESRFANTAVGAVGGAGAQKAIGMGAKYAGNRLASQTASKATQAADNAGKDAVLAAGREAGYVVPPSMTESPLAGRILEGISGKQKAAQLANVKNQNVTQRLATKALALPEGTPLNPETVKAARMQAIERGYKPVDDLGEMATSPAYHQTLDAIASDRSGVARSFPGMKNEGMEFLDSLRVQQWHTADARKAVQVLRDDAGAAWAQGEKEVAKAKLKASEAIENEIERGLDSMGKSGAELLKNFREARVMIAKTSDVEKALAKGKGKVNAEVFAAALRKGKPLSGELKTIAEFADKYGEVARVPKQGWSNPFTVIDAATGSFGSPLFPAARVGARYAALSEPGQKMFAKPSYSVGAATKLSPEVLALLERYGAGGLLSGAYSGQQ